MKRILVTGATSGIGECLVKRLSLQGLEVIACGRNQQKLAELAILENVSTVVFDVTDEQQCLSSLASQKADVYVLNAGVCEYVDVGQFEAQMFERVFAANFFGVINCFAAILPNLQSGDQVVIVDSLARLMPFTKSQAYGASKAALHYFCKSMEVDLAERGIVMQSVSPGFVATPLTAKNDFAMPMQISVEQAVEKLIRGIHKKSASIYFPTLFSLILRTASRLPTALQVALSKAMTPKQQDKH
ncbi:MAG: NAD(P)-dependent dehydrogenase (short-subunit alcohol dehydrogenase family) [Paraglaciecola sp.]|jgi:NAD(P)-dependent dehydrogenase (short-subunit alcohol dehydrogenase family)